MPTINIDAEGAEVAAGAATEAVTAAGDGSGTCPAGTSIAMAGALTGPNAALGINIVNGMQVAVDEHNEANAGCQIELKQFDTQGNPEVATQVAPQIIDDATVLGLVGPAFSGETDATGDRFFQAGLPFLTPSATRVDLTTKGWTTFFRGLGNDASQGGAGANYLTGSAGATSVCVVSDNTAYGLGLAEVVVETLGDAANDACAAEVKEGDRDFSATISLITGSGADAVYYAGYYAEAAPFITQLRDGGFEGTFMSGDGVNDAQFVEQAGSAAEGALLTCPCGPAPEEFGATYEAAFGQPAGVYSTEGYDLATILMSGIDSGVADRAGLVEYVRGYDGTGLAKLYQWNEVGELAVTNPWVFTVQ